MDFRKGLGESFRKGEVDGKKKKYCGSRAYQKFFEDYEEVSVPKENGHGTKIRRIYIGDYYRKAVSDKNWYITKFIYPVTAVAAAVLFGIAALPGSGANKTWYVTIPQAISVACYFYFFRVLCSYIAAPRNMTISEWKRGCKTLKTALMILVAGVLATAAGTMGYYLSHRSELTQLSYTYIGEYLFCVMLLCCIYFLESRSAYQKVESGTGSRKEEGNADFKR